MTNPNYRIYLDTALQLQRWRDFGAYLVVNAVLVAIWADLGGGAFWPAASLIGWGIGLSSQHWVTSIRPDITEVAIQGRMTTQAPAAAS